MNPDLRDEAARWWSAMRGPDADCRRAAFEEWLAQDPVNRREYERLEQAWEASAALASSELGRERQLTRHRPFWQLSVPTISLAAAACAVLIAFFVIWPQVTMRGADTAHMLTLRSPVGEIRAVSLPDGSRVTLDTDSEVAVRFDASVRRVELLRGRARFEVKTDPARAFIAEAGGVEVTASDARFDAQLRAEGLCLHSLAGALDVRPATRAGEGDSFRLGSEQRVIIAPSGTARAAPALAGKGSEQWVAGMLVFQRTPLAQVLAETNRYSRRHIELARPELGDLKVTGSFKPLPVDGLARALAAAFDLEVRQGASGNLILARP